MKLVDIGHVDKIYILFAVYTRPKALEIKEHLVKRIEKGVR